MDSVIRPLLFLFLAALTACTPSGPADGPADSAAPATDAQNRRQVRVQIERLEPVDFEDVIQLTGTVEARNDARLSAQSGGTIEQLLPLGSRVAAGRVLARLDSDLAMATLAQARAQLEVARAQFALADGLVQRQEPLYRDSIISDLEFENVRSQRIQAQAEVSRAEATVQQVEEQLENTRITAPFTGTVEEHFAEEGEQVLPGAPVLRIVNTLSIRVVAGVPERYASDVTVGSRARARFQVSGGLEREGTVSFASRVINPENRTFRIELDLPNQDGSLKPAMIANLQITRELLRDRLVVPQSAILRDETESSVFVVQGEGADAQAERRTVVTGASYGGRVVVDDGLESGDRVIVVGQMNVTEGDAVLVDETVQAG